jgi:hypothetical protein
MRKLLVVDNVVAFACARLEPFAVENHDAAASVPDEALYLHPLRQQRHGRPPGTHHLCEKFLSQVDLVAADAVSALQQPVIPENSIRQDSRCEGKSDHHPMRCLRSSICSEHLSPICSSRGAGLKLRTSFCVISSTLS